MRLVAWNCNMALHRKVKPLLALRPDIAVISECAEPERLRRLSTIDWMESDPVWIGRQAAKGLAVFAFNGFRVFLSPDYWPKLVYVAPVRSPSTCSPSGRRMRAATWPSRDPPEDGPGERLS